jgi:hypothetical protein
MDLKQTDFSLLWSLNLLEEKRKFSNTVLRHDAQFNFHILWCIFSPSDSLYLHRVAATTLQLMSNFNHISSGVGYRENTQHLECLLSIFVSQALRETQYIFLTTVHGHKTWYELRTRRERKRTRIHRAGMRLLTHTETKTDLHVKWELEFSGLNKNVELLSIFRKIFQYQTCKSVHLFSSYRSSGCRKRTGRALWKGIPRWYESPQTQKLYKSLLDILL